MSKRHSSHKTQKVGAQEGRSLHVYCFRDIHIAIATWYDIRVLTTLLSFCLGSVIIVSVVQRLAEDNSSSPQQPDRETHSLQILANVVICSRLIATV